jgi:indole-3-glycerol phosphate synthase
MVRFKIVSFMTCTTVILQTILFVATLIIKVASFQSTSHFPGGGAVNKEPFKDINNPLTSLPKPITFSTSSVRLYLSTRNIPEDLYAAVHRKEYEMKTVHQQHRSTADPVRMAMSYGQETPSNMRLARALRRVHDDPFKPQDDDTVKRKEKFMEHGLQEMTMRRASFIVDIKRKSLSRPHEKFCNYDDAGMVAEAMVRLGADVVFVNVDYHAYGGDMAELKTAVNAVRKASKTAAVVMKDIVVDEIQLGLAKEAGADGILLIASVLGPALDNFLDLATTIGLETIVECHTRNEVQRSLDAMATNILVSNYDRVAQVHHPLQAIQLAGLFPGSGGPIICLAGGGIETPEQMKRHLAVGYDGVVVGKAVMGSTKAPEFIRVVRDRSLLPAELSQWGLEDVEFDLDGNPMPGPKENIPDPYDEDTYQ